MKFNVGLQLFSVRDDMARDMDGTLKAVAEMGYDCVEFAGYFDKSAEEIRAMLDKYGLKAVSVHQAYEPVLAEPDKMISYLKTLGVKYCAVPWMDKSKHKGGTFDETVRDFMTVGKALKANGIQFLYHNHDFEFQKYEDKYLFDWLYESLPADILMTEIDTCWVKYAGEDPCRYLRKYSGRAPVVHLKDFTAKTLAAGPVYTLIDENGKEGKAPTREERSFEFKPVGYGMQDFPSILKAAEQAGAHTVIVEQDMSVERPAMEAAKMSREYLKSIGV